jgi:aspartyl protease family protein
MRRDRFRRLMPLRVMCTVFAAAAGGAGLAPAATGGPLSRCDLGQLIVNEDGSQGRIIRDGGKECLVKSADGRFQSWVPITQLRVATAQIPAAPATGLTPAPMDDKVKVLRPMDLGSELIFPADALGHVLLTANVNDVPLHFLVDTGATLVALTPADAEAAGIHRSELTFDKTVQTAAGPARAAFLELHEIRIKQLEIDDVRAAVIDDLKQSVLGMSFLRRLKGFEVRDGALTMRW